jgi:hypothetical protein
MSYKVSSDSIIKIELRIIFYKDKFAVVDIDISYQYLLSIIIIDTDAG